MTAADAAFVVTGAGLEDANGLFVPSGRTWHEAPVFENDRKCLLSREPHRNQKTGGTSFGWILGQDRKPLYAVESESLLPPAAGWRRFNGAQPTPQLKQAASIAEAAEIAASAFKVEGNGLFAVTRYAEAEGKWSRALGLMEHVGDKAMEVALYSNRAEARLRQSLWDGALSDAQAALKRRPDHDKAILRAAVAARELKWYDLARDFAQQCVDLHPKLPEAKQMLFEILHILDEEASKLPDTGAAMRQNLTEALRPMSHDSGPSTIKKQFGAKDVNSKKGFKAFEGYSDDRSAAAEAKDDRPAISDMPYHKMGLEPSQINSMDKFFKAHREKLDNQERKEREEQRTYEEVKQEYKLRKFEDQIEGRKQAKDGFLPTEVQEPQAPHDGAENKQERTLAITDTQIIVGDAKPYVLSRAELNEIDSLFY